MDNPTTVLLIVLFNKKPEDSTTLLSLLNCEINNIKIVIHNNGPELVVLSENILKSFKQKQIQYELVNFVSNKPLSVLYNEFIDSNPSCKVFVLLDDDSEITQSYAESIKNFNHDLEVPRIVSKKDGVIYYPISNGKIITHDASLNVIGTHSIGSGLIISRNMISQFKSNKITLFDENYALYGVDVSLFRRMWLLTKKGINFKVKTSSSILHSLSRTEAKETDFRRLERVIDFAITVRHYPTFRSYLSFCKRLLIQLSKMRFKDSITMITVFLRGKHPRCSKVK
ncbi:glycosyltransferase family 2 protein [Erwinia sp. B116]|uniref:glycosyltransferase family 2 protein n=1 Tax=Erwinia sp. B116 TaxID=1561024 RepID=UPI0011AFCB2C|nr:glycosyl transferase [Erwinia sp. B116]